MAQIHLKSAVGLLLACSLAAPALAAERHAYGDDECQRAARISAAPGAEYQPGVDVNGRPVAPADIQPGVKIDPPRVIEFPVTMDVAKRLGFDTRGPYEANVTVANVRIDGNRVSINGQEVNPDDSVDLVAACRAAKK